MEVTCCGDNEKGRGEEGGREGERDEGRVGEMAKGRGGKDSRGEAKRQKEER